MPIEQRITHYFIAMGAQQAPDNEPSQDGATFTLGAEKIRVVILNPEQLAQRNAILDAVLNLSSLRGLYHMVYLAAPRVLGATIDATLFRSRGIGLLFFDDRRIDEAVIAQPLQSGPMPVDAQPQDNSLAAELATLRSMYFEMEHSLNQLRNDLRTIRDAPQTTQELRQLPRQTEDPIPQPVFPQNLPPSGELPSYFANNPWLEVLSKRGVGERGTIAG